MSDYRLIGLESIAIGAARTSAAGMPATLTTILSIVPDSAFLTIEPPGKNEFMVEDSDFPDIVVNTPSAKMFEFATQDMLANNLYFALGGTTGATVYKMPNTAVVVNQYAIKAISKTYNGSKLQVEVVNTNLRGHVDLQFSKSKPGTVGYQADILRPIALNTDVPVKITYI